MLPFVPWTRPPQSTAPPPWLAALRRGDVAGLEAAYRQEGEAVYRYALALSGDAALAADVTQEAFVALAQAPERFDPQRGTLGAYLAGIARHALLAAWRLRDRHLPLDDAFDDDDAAPAGWAAGTDAELIGRQSVVALWEAVRALPWPFREALVLVDLQERPYADAARIAGVELNTLRTRVHRARQRLALALGASPRSLP